MADYRYVSTWRLQAPIQQVWAASTTWSTCPPGIAASRKPGSWPPATPRAWAAGSGT
jgi:hypothetical protein